LNDQTDDHANHEGPLSSVERLLAYVQHLLVRRAVDAAVDERLAGLGEECPKVEAIEDELHADRPPHVKGVCRQHPGPTRERPNNPDEGGDGEHGVVRSIGDDDPFQIRWQTTTHARRDGIEAPRGYEPEKDKLNEGDEEGTEAQG